MGFLQGTEETTIHGYRSLNGHDKSVMRSASESSIGGGTKPPRHQARLALVAACEALTAVFVTAVKLASATSAACLAALLTLS